MVTVVTFSVVGLVVSVVSVVGDSVVALVAWVVGVSVLVVFWSAAQCSAVGENKREYT